MGCLKFLGQEFFDPVDRVIGDPCEHFAQIGFRFSAIELSGFDQRQNAGGAFAAFVGAGEQPILPA